MYLIKTNWKLFIVTWNRDSIIYLKKGQCTKLIKNLHQSCSLQGRGKMRTNFILSIHPASKTASQAGKTDKKNILCPDGVGQASSLGRYRIKGIWKILAKLFGLGKICFVSFIKDRKTLQEGKCHWTFKTQTARILNHLIDVTLLIGTWSFTKLIFR